MRCDDDDDDDDERMMVPIATSIDTKKNAIMSC